MAGPFFVDGAVGNDSNAGTSPGAGNAWATVQKGADTAVAGEKVWVKASANYVEQVDFDTNAGTGPLRIVFEGYTTTTGDGGRATITGSNVRASCLVMNGTADYLTLRNFDLTSPTGQCISATGAVDGLLMENVRMLKGSSTPAHAMTANGYSRFASTVISRCVVSGGFSGDGIDGFSDGLITDTVITGCGGSGYHGRSYANAPEFRRCLITLNSGDGLHFTNACSIPRVFDCTIDGNSGDGIDIGGANNAICQIYNNLITNHPSGTGLLIGSQSGTTSVLADYNFYYNNSTNTSGTNTVGNHDVTLSVNPYTNSGASDWTLNNTATGGASVRAAAGSISSSPNISYLDGGSLQHQDSGGSSGPAAIQRIVQNIGTY